MTENWLPITAYDGYEVSDLGRVRSTPRIVNRKDGRALRVAGKILNLYVVRVKGKPSSVRVTLRSRGLLVHNLVLLAFDGVCPPGQEGCHNDGNPLRNMRSNLRWDTREQNIEDRYRHGRKRASTRRVQGRNFISGYVGAAMGFTS